MWPPLWCTQWAVSLPNLPWPAFPYFAKIIKILQAQFWSVPELYKFQESILFTESVLVWNFKIKTQQNLLAKCKMQKKVTRVSKICSEVTKQKVWTDLNPVCSIIHQRRTLYKMSPSLWKHTKVTVWSGSLQRVSSEPMVLTVWPCVHQRESN